MRDRWKRRVDEYKQRITVLARMRNDRRLPWRARLVLFCVVGYALSPIDLIPDFIPVLGWLDDFVLLPFGIWIAFKLIPREVRFEYLKKEKY